MDDNELNAAMVGIGPNKTWEQAHDEAMRVILAMALREQALQAKLDIALKWLDKIASVAGERQRSATETEDFYLKGVHDADTATYKLVKMAKEEIETDATAREDGA